MNLTETVIDISVENRRNSTTNVVKIKIRRHLIVRIMKTTNINRKNTISGIVGLKRISHIGTGIRIQIEATTEIGTQIDVTVEEEIPIEATIEIRIETTAEIRIVAIIEIKMEIDATIEILIQTEAITEIRTMIMVMIGIKTLIVATKSHRTENMKIVLLDMIIVTIENHPEMNILILVTMTTKGEVDSIIEAIGTTLLEGNIHIQETGVRDILEEVVEDLDLKGGGEELLEELMKRKEKFLLDFRRRKKLDFIIIITRKITLKVNKCRIITTTLLVTIQAFKKGR
jgi:hypothetical protein